MADDESFAFRYGQQLAAQRSAAAQNVLAARNTNPDTAAQANALAPQTGIPADTIERNYSEVSSMFAGQRNAQTVAASPQLSTFFSNPRKAAVGHDDVPNLSQISTNLSPPQVIDRAVSSLLGTDTVAGSTIHRLNQQSIYPAATPFAQRAAVIRAQAQGTAAAVQAARPDPSVGSWWTGQAVNLVNGFRAPFAGAKIAMDDAMGVEASGDINAAQAINDQTQAYTPNFKGNAGSLAYDTVGSLVGATPALVAGIFTGGAGGAVVGGLQGGLTSYGTYRAEGDTPEASAIGAGASGVVNAASMGLPAEALAGKFGEQGAKRFIGNFLMKDLAGMELQTVAGGAVDTAEDPNATWGEYFKNLPKGMGKAALNAAFSAGVFGAAHHVVRALAPIEEQASQATTALATSQFLDATMATAEASKLRARDPDSFQQFVDQHTAGSPVENVYVPADKVRELMQSDAYDPRDWDWAPDLNEQLGQAEATGGDVVLPLAGVAAHMAGSKTWDAIKGDVRLDPGGISLNEANDFNTHYADVMDEQGKQAADAYRAEQEARAPEQKVYEDVFSQLRQNGFNVRAAQAQADLYTAHYATMAERTGTDAHSLYRQSNLSVQTDLPDTVEGYRKADNLDVVINAMKRGAEEKKPTTDSLLQFISKGGGVEDKGGDIASMGGDKWHREQAFRKRLIRPSGDDRQGDMVGGADETSTGYGLDDWGQKAFDAGYFPNAGERPTTNDMLEAIGQELRGSPIHPSEDSTASDAQKHVAQAADDLRQFLASRGIDADKATRPEIETALKDRPADRSLKQSARGRIDIGPDGSHVIRLFQGRDMSTFLHETGHLWLEEFKRLAEAPDAAPQIREDYQKILDWFEENGHGVGNGAQINDDAHELFARGVERYLMEGKAPSSALSGAFAAFRSWLLRIYSVVRNLNAPLTPEIRGVMDRMLATDDAIGEAQDRVAAKALPQHGLGMTDAEYKAYQGSVDGARTEAFDALLYRTMETVRKARTKEWKEERARIHADVTAQVEARPEWQAIARMRDKGDEAMPLDRQSIIDEYGEDALKLIPKGVPPTVVSRGGVHPDILAESVGLGSGRDLIDRLMGVQQRENELQALGHKSGAAKREAIDTETDAAMRERHGDMLTDGSIEEEAMAAIHSDQRATIMASELRALAKKTGNVPTPWAKAKEWAEGIVRDGLISEQSSASALARHQRNEAKAARAAEKAILAGDTDEAFREKQKQMLSAAMYRAAKDAKDDVAKIAKRLGNLAKAKTLKSMDQDYLDRIHALLEQYDLRPRTAKSIKEREGFASWVEAKRAAGEEVFISPRLFDAGDTHFSRMTYADLTGLDDTIASIAFLGRRKKELLIAGEQRDYAEWKDEARQVAEPLPNRKFSAEIGDKPSMVSEGLASLLQPEFLFDELDGHNPNGPFNRLFVHGAADAANKLDALRKDVAEPLADLYHSLPREARRRLQERVTIPDMPKINPDGSSAPGVWRRLDLLGVALNLGTESNLDKMLRGHGWDQPTVERVLHEQLNADEWQFVDKAWKQVGSLWPEIARVERELTGVVPEKIDARPVDTPFGKLDGGYWPVVYDPDHTLGKQLYKDDAEALFGQIGRSVGTPKGHTISRTDFAAPLDFSLERIFNNHINRVATRVAYGQWARDALKAMRDPQIRNLIDAKRGLADYKQLEPWLRGQINTAKADTATLKGLENILKQTRINTTLVGLGFRLLTVVKHFGYLANTAKEIGPVATMNGVRLSLAHIGKNTPFVFQRSPEMAARGHDYDQSVRSAFAQMSTRYNGNAAHDALISAQEGSQRIGFWAMGHFLTHVVAIPTWLGAYHKALGEGMTEADAALYGDKVIRRTQGTGRAMGLSSFQRGSEAMKQLGLFYTYFGTLLNQQREAARALGRGDWRRAANTGIWMLAAEPLANALISGEFPDDPGSPTSWAEWIADKVFFNLWGGVPLVRNVASGAQRFVEGKAPSMQAAIADSTEMTTLRGFVQMGQVMDDAIHKARGDEVSSRWLQHAIETPGYFLGLPTGQPAATIDYGAGVVEGEQHPNGAGDVIKGIVKGRQKDQE